MKPVRLSRHEYWILEAVVVSRMPLAYIFSPEVEVLLNKRGPGCDPETLAETVSRYCRKGLLECSDDKGNRVTPTKTDILASVAIGLRARDLSQSLVCSLSESGGSTWEAYARPRWDVFVLEEYELLAADAPIREDELLTLTCQSESRLVKLVEAYRSLGILHSVWTEEQLEAVGDWNATYWKTLHGGYRARLRVSEVQKAPHYDEWGTYFGLRKSWYER
jgi:hypothetical protein